MKKLLSSWYITHRTVYTIAGITLVSVLSVWFAPLLFVAQGATIVLLLCVLAETFALYRKPFEVTASRDMDIRLSNGDENEIRIHLDSTYPFTLQAKIIDELPVQFQVRDFFLRTTLTSGARFVTKYCIRPAERGSYIYGAVNIFVTTSLGVVERRFRCEAEREVVVYPSIIGMRRAEIQAFSQKASAYGVRKLRRVGHTMEFEKIKTYVAGDDVRTINWKATARSTSMMVNLYQDERAQDVYSIIDMGRVMKMPFNKMTLLDYSINSVLAFSNVVLKKYDRAGLLTFGVNPGAMVQAAARHRQLGTINQQLYNLSTGFEESDDENIVAMVRRVVKQRSLLMFYTNIESLASLKRRMPYLAMLAKQHVLVVVFFENTELRAFSEAEVKNVQDVYYRTIAQTMMLQKREIVKNLRAAGVYTVLTKPEDLSMKTIEAYLSLKARGVI